MTYIIFPYYTRLERKLVEMGKRYRLSCRWSSSDEVVQMYKGLLTKNKRKQLLSSLWAACTKRLFLLKLKAKYAGMYMIV